MPSSPRKTRHDQAVERRNQLLDAALQLFAEVGFERATIKMLARSAGVSQGLIYHYFANKEELIAAVMERNSLIPQLRDLYRSAQHLSAREALPTLIAELQRLMWERKETIWLFFREIRTNPHIAARTEEMRHENLSLLAGYLQERVQAGELRPHDCLVTARTLVAAVFQSTVLGPFGEGYVPGLADLLLQGVLPR